MGPSISTEIEVAAPPAAIWAVITDYERYLEWNPFLAKISGDKEVGGRLTVTLNPPDNSPGMTFSPLIQIFLPNQHLNWRGRLLSVPWLFTGRHHFILHPNGTGTRFEQTEHFTGILALVLHWIGSNMFKTTRRGFVLMNKALKERVERKPSPNPELTQRAKTSAKADD